MPPETSSSTPARGVQRLWDPRVWGTTVGAAGGSVFVMVNRSDLGDPWSTVALSAWVVAFGSYLWFVLVVPRWFEAPAALGKYAGLVYLASVIAMLALIRIGSGLLDDADRPGLRPALIVTAVGLHFLPFATAFATPLFRLLGTAMTGMGVAGLGLGWAVREELAAWAAVLAGVVMVAVITADAARSRSRARQQDDLASGGGAGRG